jgi:hypothetical protein
MVLGKTLNWSDLKRRTFDIATCMDDTGIVPFTRQAVYVARRLRDRKMQRELMQFFKPENYFTVREALIQAGRADLIGSGRGALIPAQPPTEALQARRRQANQAARGDHYHAVANPAKAEPAGERRLTHQGALLKSSKNPLFRSG